MIVGNFSEKLKYYRKRAGLSQAMLSLKIGVTAAQVSKYERNAAEPRPEILKKIANVLDVPVEELLTDKIKISINNNQHIMTLLQVYAYHTREDDNQKYNLSRYMDIYISPKLDIAFINRIKLLFYEYLKSISAENHPMIEIIEKSSLKSIKLEYELIE